MTCLARMPFAAYCLLQRDLHATWCKSDATSANIMALKGSQTFLVMQCSAATDGSLPAGPPSYDDNSTC